MKYQFKGTYDNLIYNAKSDLDLATTVYSVETLTEDELDKINKGYKISLVDGNLVFTDDKEIEKGIKKRECNELIEARYKLHDQINILDNGTAEEIAEMKAYKYGILNEYRTNGADADYSAYIN